MATHPRQPFIVVDGVVRFKGNAIIQKLFRDDRINLSEIACWNIPVEDLEQFWQRVTKK